MNETDDMRSGTRAAVGSPPEHISLDAMRETMRKAMERMTLAPPPLVLMRAPVPRGVVYMEKEPGSLLPLKERAHVALVHPDDVTPLQVAFAAAGLPVPRVGSADDLKPWEPPPLVFTEPEPLWEPPSVTFAKLEPRGEPLFPWASFLGSRL